jgi:gamma-glutamyltranspeptidase/glutathione hydrolase
MLQVFLNIIEYGMTPQAAVEAPRFATYSIPDSHWPHDYAPGKLRLERALADCVASELDARGHRTEVTPDNELYMMGGVCVVARDPETGVVTAAADPRRECYAAAW